MSNDKRHGDINMYTRLKQSRFKEGGAKYAKKVQPSDHPGPDGGRIDRDTIVSTELGKFNGVRYRRHEAMFTGKSSRGNPYRVPCQVIAPEDPHKLNGVCLFDYLNPTAIFIPAIGREFGFGLHVLGQEFLFNRGVVYATVRCDLDGIGKPWLDTGFDSSGEQIVAPADEFDIVHDFVRALTSDPVARALAGPVKRKMSLGYSASGGLLRGLLRTESGRRLFDCSLPGGCGAGVVLPNGDDLVEALDASPPPEDAGFEVNFSTETEVVLFNAAPVRIEAPNARSFELAGGAHLRSVDVAIAGLPSPETANPLNWYPIVCALFAAAECARRVTDMPTSIWLGAAGDETIRRDAN